MDNDLFFGLKDDDPVEVLEHGRWIPGVIDGRPDNEHVTMRLENGLHRNVHFPENLRRGPKPRISN
jgi:hypothetical protein